MLINFWRSFTDVKNTKFPRKCTQLKSTNILKMMYIYCANFIDQWHFQNCPITKGLTIECIAGYNYADNNAELYNNSTKIKQSYKKWTNFFVEPTAVKSLNEDKSTNNTILKLCSKWQVNLKTCNYTRLLLIVQTATHPPNCWNISLNTKTCTHVYKATRNILIAKDVV